MGTYWFHTEVFTQPGGTADRIPSYSFVDLTSQSRLFLTAHDPSWRGTHVNYIIYSICLCLCTHYTKSYLTLSNYSARILRLHEMSRVHPGELVAAAACLQVTWKCPCPAPSTRCLQVVQRRPCTTPGRCVATGPGSRPPTDRSPCRSTPRPWLP